MKSLDFGYVSVRDSMEARAHNGCLAAESLSVIERDHIEDKKSYIYIRLVEMGVVNLVLCAYWTQATSWEFVFLNLADLNFLIDCT